MIRLQCERAHPDKSTPGRRLQHLNGDFEERPVRVQIAKGMTAQRGTTPRDQVGIG
jgi:hypothetical protein